MRTKTILLIEDNPADVRLIRELLKETQFLKDTIITAGTIKEINEQVQRNKIDIILMDLNLCGSNGTQTFHTVYGLCPDVPIIILSGMEQPELFLSFIKEGAQDYLSKNEIDSRILERSMQFSLARKNSNIAVPDSIDKLFNSLDNKIPVMMHSGEQKKAQADSERSRQAYKSLFEHNPDGVYSFDLNGIFKSANKSLAKMADSTVEELLKISFFSMVIQEDVDRVFDHFWKAAKGQPQKYEAEMVSAKGRKYFVHMTNIPIVVDDEIIGVFGIAKDITDRRKAQKELSESELKFRSVLQSAPDAIILTDEKMKIIYWNNSAKKLFSYDEKEIIGKSIDILFPHSDETQFDDLKSREYGRVHENIGVRKDGTEFPIEHNSSAWNSDGGKKICCFIRDITERRRAVEKFLTIIKTIVDGYCIIDIHEGKILEVNDSYCRMTGYDRNELLQMKVQDMDALESPEAVRTHINNMHKTGYERFVTRHRTKSGNLIDFDVIVTFSNIEKDKFIVFLHDITEQKQMEETLRRSETNLRAIFENTNTGFILLDTQLNILSFNKMGAHLAQKALGKELKNRACLLDMLPLERKQPFSDMTGKVIKGEAINYEIQYLRKDKHSICLEINCKPVINDRNSVIGISFAVNDITERKKSEEKLISLNRELETFIYKSSHDLRSPLASILGLIMISKKEIEDKQALRYFNMIQELAKKLDDTLLKLVQSLFIDETKGFADKIDFTAIIAGTMQKLMHNQNYDKIKISYKVSPDMAFVSSKFILESIFQNLMGNAIKYQKANSYDSFLKISVSHKKNKIFIVFEDNGIGMDPVYLNRIFEMYFRATEVSSGSGLGLYIVKKGVEKLGGTVSVESTNKEGSIFRVILPMQ